MIYFDHEKLKVYQRAMDFVIWQEPVLKKLPAGTTIKDQFDRAAISIVLNIAEGNGKSGAKDRRRYFEISRGSALECAACLDILYSKKLIDKQEVSAGKELLRAVVAMLTKLNQSLTNMVKEESPEYDGE